MSRDAKAMDTALAFLSDLSKIFESDFILNKNNFTTNYDKKVMSQFIAELVRYHFPDVKSFSVAKDVFS